jgi:large subunit ribosomal protein L35e
MILNVSCSHSVRKAIAAVLTVISQTQKQQLRLHFKGKKYKPVDLRPKLTRAKRRALKTSELNKKSNKQIQAARHFSPRRFAIKA